MENGKQIYKLGNWYYGELSRLFQLKEERGNIIETNRKASKLVYYIEVYKKTSSIYGS